MYFVNFVKQFVKKKIVKKKIVKIICENIW